MAYSARLFQCQKTKTIRGFVLPAATTLRPKGGEVGSILESPGAQQKSVNGGVTRPSGRHYRRLWRRLEHQVACKVLRTTEGPRTEKARTRVEPQIPLQVSLSIGDDAGLTSMKADLDRRREPLTMKVIIGDDRGQSSTPTMWEAACSGRRRIPQTNGPPVSYVESAANVRIWRDSDLP